MEEPSAGGGGYDDLLTTPPPPPSCPICMHPWACDGGHRICCIPCGHVYGRSCLETWLDRSGPNSAKCPQCGENFEHKLIINLHVLENLWDGCFQELKERLVSTLVEQMAQSEAILVERMAEYKARSDDINADMLADIEKQHADQIARISEIWSGSCKRRAVFHDKIMADTIESLTDEYGRLFNEKMSMVDAYLTSLKERIKKMAEENAAAADVVEFMQRGFPEISYMPVSASASAPVPPAVDSENTRGHSNRLLLTPIPAPPGRANAVKRNRHRGT